MPFDEHDHNGGGGGDEPNHFAPDEMLDICIDAAAKTAEMNGYCMGCTMTRVATRLMARSMAFLADAIRQDNEREGVTEAATVEEIRRMKEKLMRDALKRYHIELAETKKREDNDDASSD